MYHRLAVLGSSGTARDHIIKCISDNELNNNKTGENGCDMYKWVTGCKKLTYIIKNYDWSPVYTPSKLYIPELCTVLVIHDVSKEVDECADVIRTALRHHYKNDIHFIGANQNPNLTANGHEISSSFQKFKTNVLSILDEEIDIAEKVKMKQIRKSNDNVYDECEKQVKIDSLRRMRKDVESKYFLVSDCAKKLKAHLTRKEKVKCIESTHPSRKQLDILNKCYEDLSKTTLIGENQVKTITMKRTKTKKPDKYTESLKRSGLILQINDDFVITNIEQMLNILQNISKAEYFTANNNTNLQGEEQQAEEFLNNGIVCEKYLEEWCKYIQANENININIGCMLEILKFSNMCYEITKEDSTYGRFFYFPCFVKKVSDISNVVDVTQPMIVNGEKMSMHFKVTFLNHIPLYLYDELCAALHSSTLNTTNWKCTPWKDGVYVSTGDTEHIVFRNKEDKSESISLCVRGMTNYVLLQMWAKFEEMENSFMKKLKPWNIIITKRGFVSPHCILKNIDPPYIWEIKNVIEPTDSTLETNCGCDQVDDMIPQAGFVKNLDKEKETYQQQINAVKSYLKKECASTMSRESELNQNINQNVNERTDGHTQQRNQDMVPASNLININVTAAPGTPVHFQIGDIYVLPQTKDINNCHQVQSELRKVVNTVPHDTDASHNGSDSCIQSQLTRGNPKHDIATDNSAGSRESDNSILMEPSSSSHHSAGNSLNTKSRASKIFQGFAMGDSSSENTD